MTTDPKTLKQLTTHKDATPHLMRTGTCLRKAIADAEAAVARFRLIRDDLRRVTPGSMWFDEEMSEHEREQMVGRLAREMRFAQGVMSDATAAVGLTSRALHEAWEAFDDTPPVEEAQERVARCLVCGRERTYLLPRGHMRRKQLEMECPDCTERTGLRAKREHEDLREVAMGRTLR